MNHQLTVVSHGVRRPSVTLAGLLPGDFKSCK